MYIILVCVLCLSSRSLASNVITAEELDNALRTGIDVRGSLADYGYPSETHQVTTEDGYSLTLHRIPYGNNESDPDTKTKPVVLILPGLLSNSVDYYTLGPNHSIALLLADQGYDVWLGNNRGNTWGRKHLNLNPDRDESFWDFSFHELGVYDDTAMIDYILNETGKEKLSIVGYSQGTTQFFVMASMKPEYNEKVTVMAALAPSVYQQNVPHLLVQILKDFYPQVELAASDNNITEVMAHSVLTSVILGLACSETGDYHQLCALVFFVIGGIDTYQLDRAIIPTLLQSYPAGGSIKQLLHYLQEVKSGHFRQFDYGVIKNLDMYQQASPPDYNISLVTAPVALYYGNNDWLVGQADVDRLADELPNLVEKHLIDYEFFTNYDFIFGTDVAPMLYYDVVNMLNAHNGLDPIPTGDKSVTTLSPETITAAGFTCFNLASLLYIYIGMVIMNRIV